MRTRERGAAVKVNIFAGVQHQSRGRVVSAKRVMADKDGCGGFVTDRLLIGHGERALGACERFALRNCLVSQESCRVINASTPEE